MQKALLFGRNCNKLVAILRSKEGDRMDLLLAEQMLKDPAITDLRKLHYKYPQADRNSFLSYLKTSCYRELSLPDFKGNPLVYLECIVNEQAKNLSLSKDIQDRNPFALSLLEDEIASSLQIEGIRVPRENIRKILQGSAPSGKEEEQIYGMKLGLDFIQDPEHSITEENIYQLYEVSIVPFLEEENRLLPGQHYRHAPVYIVGDKTEHSGLHPVKLAESMKTLVEFIQQESELNDFFKASVIHFYLAYLHPYFDGNGRMARFLHLWYLLQCGYTLDQLLPFSSRILTHKNDYYKAYSLIEKNAALSGVIDVTPFLTYFTRRVYATPCNGSATGK